MGNVESGPVKVRDPRGRRWRVTRRWLPWRPRRRQGLDPHLMIEAADGLTVLVLALVLGLVILPLLSIVVVLALEWLLLLTILPVVVLLRVAFGHRWYVEARIGFTPYWEEEAGTWAQSRERIRAVAGAIERGDPPQRTLGSEPDPED